MSQQANTTTRPSILDGQVITRAVLYARVSGNDDKYASSGIESQLKECRAYAETKGYHIVGEFFEDPTRPTSGADWLPELERALELAHQNGYDVLIVREIDRLARNRFKQLAIETDLEALDKRVEYVIGQYEDTVEGRLLKGVMSEFSQFEREKIKERIGRGMLNSVKNGNVLIGGFTPYAYYIETANGKRGLAVNEAEAATVKLIFDLYARQGKTIREIANYLDKRSVSRPQKKATKGWSVTSIDQILSNETYVGRWHYRKTKRVKSSKTGKSTRVSRPKNEWLMVEVPAIVSETTFAEAQRLKDTNKRIRESKTRRTYLLGGMIKCAHCSNGVIGMTVTNSVKEYSYYKCSAAHQPNRYDSKCTESKPHHTRKIDAVVWGWLKAILLDSATLQRSLDEYQKESDKTQDPILRMIEASESKLAKLEDQHKRLIDAYTAGVLSLDDLAKSKADLDKQMSDTSKAIEALQADLDPQTLTEDDIDAIHQFAEAFRENVDLIDADLPARREIAKLLQVKVAMARVYVDVSCVLGERLLSVSSLPKKYGRARIPA